MNIVYIMILFSNIFLANFFQNFLKEIHQIANFGSGAYMAPVKITYFFHVVLIGSPVCYKNMGNKMEIYGEIV